MMTGNIYEPNPAIGIAIDRDFYLDLNKEGKVPKSQREQGKYSDLARSRRLFKEGFQPATTGSMIERTTTRKKEVKKLGHRSLLAGEHLQTNDDQASKTTRDAYTRGV